MQKKHVGIMAAAHYPCPVDVRCTSCDFTGEGTASRGGGLTKRPTCAAAAARSCFGACLASEPPVETDCGLDTPPALELSTSGAIGLASGPSLVGEWTPQMRINMSSAPPAPSCSSGAHSGAPHRRSQSHELRPRSNSAQLSRTVASPSGRKMVYAGARSCICPCWVAFFAASSSDAPPATDSPLRTSRSVRIARAMVALAERADVFVEGAWSWTPSDVEQAARIAVRRGLHRKLCDTRTKPSRNGCRRSVNIVPGTSWATRAKPADTGALLPRSWLSVSKHDNKSSNTTTRGDVASGAGVRGSGPAAGAPVRTLAPTCCNPDSARKAYAVTFSRRALA